MIHRLAQREADAAIRIADAQQRHPPGASAATRRSTRSCRRGRGSAAHRGLPRRLACRSRRRGGPRARFPSATPDPGRRRAARGLRVDLDADVGLKAGGGGQWSGSRVTCARQAAARPRARRPAVPGPRQDQKPCAVREQSRSRMARKTGSPLSLPRAKCQAAPGAPVVRTAEFWAASGWTHADPARAPGARSVTGVNVPAAIAPAAAAAAITGVPSRLRGIPSSQQQGHRHDARQPREHHVRIAVSGVKAAARPANPSVRLACASGRETDCAVRPALGRTRRLPVTSRIESCARRISCAMPRGRWNETPWMPLR